MTRIESSKEAQIHRLESEVGALQKKVRRAERRRYGKLIQFVVIVAVIISVAGYCAARTGLVYIPLVSALVYKEPEPARWIDPFTVSDTALSDLVQNQLGAVSAQLVREKTATVTLQFSEEELTSALRTEQQRSRESTNVTYAQVVLLTSAAELFARVRIQGREVPVMLTVLPEVRDNSVDIRVDSFKLGAARLPAALGQFIINTAVEPVIDTALRATKAVASIESIEISEGTAEVTVKLHAP